MSTAKQILGKQRNAAGAGCPATPQRKPTHFWRSKGRYHNDFGRSATPVTNPA
jgi:hypothetical protein